MMICRICANTKGNRNFIVREMLFGTRDQFDYFECGKCGCLQIAEIPVDLSPYYPEDYYSLAVLEETNVLKKYLRRQRFRAATGNGGIVGRFVVSRFGNPAALEWVTKTSIKSEDAILDVGCGGGKILIDLSDYGFRNLTGADKFIGADISYQNGVKIFRREMKEMGGQYNLVMLHHSFEHMPDPRDALRDVYQLLKPGRFALIRIPVGQSYAWRTYGVNWVALDAPRHLYLHTRASMQRLVTEVGFQLVDMVCDSTAFQFWGSEQYQRDIHMFDERSHWGTCRGQIFSKEEIRSFQAQAEALNQKGDGDQACFYLFKPE